MKAIGSYLRETLRSPLVIKSGIASIDQAMLSGLNFFISLFLIKTVTKMEYGYYSIAFAVSLFLISVQNAIVNTPLAVLLSSKKDREKDEYAASLYYGQYIGIVPVVVLGLVGIIVLGLWETDSQQASIATAVCLAVIGILFREYFRAYFFANERPTEVLKCDAVYVIIFVILGGLTYAYLGLGVATIFLLMGVCGVLVSALVKPSKTWRYNQRAIKESYGENWQFGKWALIGVAVTHIQNYSYLYLMGVLMSSVAVADVSASRILFIPFVLGREGWSRVAIPHGSRLRENGQLRRFFREQIISSVLFVLCIVLYVAIMNGISESVQGVFLTDQYDRAIELTLLWGAVFAVSFVSLNASIGLQVAKDFRVIAKVNAISMVITIVMAYILINSYGIEGALVSLLVGYIVLGGALWSVFLERVACEDKGGINVEGLVSILKENGAEKR